MRPNIRVGAGLAAILTSGLLVCQDQPANRKKSKDGDATAHGATLKWSPPANAQYFPGKVRYIIYRANAVNNKHGGQDCKAFQKLTEVSDTTYTDPTVKPQHVYCYEVRAVVSGHKPGPPSQVVVGEVPRKSGE